MTSYFSFPSINHLFKEPEFVPALNLWNVFAPSQNHNALENEQTYCFDYIFWIFSDNAVKDFSETLSNFGSFFKVNNFHSFMLLKKEMIYQLFSIEIWDNNIFTTILLPMPNGNYHFGDVLSILSYQSEKHRCRVSSFHLLSKNHNVFDIFSIFDGSMALEKRAVLLVLEKAENLKVNFSPFELKTMFSYSEDLTVPNFYLFLSTITAKQKNILHEEGYFEMPPFVRKTIVEFALKGM